MKKYVIYEDFHEKNLYIYVWDYEKFCRLMDKKWVDTSEEDWDKPLALYHYIDGEGGFIWLSKPIQSYLLHELVHYTRDIWAKIGYGKEELHEYYAYAMEWYIKTCKKKMKIK